jgi:hypothetical protein
MGKVRIIYSSGPLIFPTKIVDLSFLSSDGLTIMPSSDVRNCLEIYSPYANGEVIVYLYTYCICWVMVQVLYRIFLVLITFRLITNSKAATRSPVMVIRDARVGCGNLRWVRSSSARLSRQVSASYPEVSLMTDNLFSSLQPTVRKLARLRKNLIS